MQRYADIGRRQQLAAVLTAVAATVAGCGNGSTGQLSLRALGKGAGSEPPSGGAPSGMTGTSSTTGGAGSDGGSGSTLNPTDAGTGAPAEAGPGSVQGRAVFETILPDLSSTCGGACHAQGAGGAPLWLGPPDPYISAVSFPGIVVANPGASIVITKGRHEGPALQDPLLTQVTQWLTVEAAALPVVTLPQTPPFAVTMGANNIDCSAAGVAGTHITFDAAVTGNDITLSNLNLVAPAATGVHIVYPIFAVLPQGAPEIDDQSFSNEDQTVGAGETAPLGPGLLILTDWSAGRMQGPVDLHRQRGARHPGQHLPHLPQLRRKRQRCHGPLGSRGHAPGRRDGLRSGSRPGQPHDAGPEQHHPRSHRRTDQSPLHQGFAELRHDDGDVDRRRAVSASIRFPPDSERKSPCGPCDEHI
jgi:hypothetical protein